MDQARKGVALLAIGSEGYMLWAVNMACSIKYFSPDLPIQLIASADMIERVKENEYDKLFDYFTEMQRPHYEHEGRLAPGKAKLKMYEYFIFDKTLYFDTDGLVIKDCRPLFDLVETQDFASLHTHVHSTYTLEKDSPDMYWCSSSVIREHYKLSADTMIPATNSSFMLVETRLPDGQECDANQKLFAQAYGNIALNPIPEHQRNLSWGRNRNLQPDELYLNIACAQTGIYPGNAQPIYFRPKLQTGPPLEINAIRELGFYAIGLYGDERFSHSSLHSVYDRHIMSIIPEILPHKPIVKAHQLLPQKLSNYN